MLPFISVCLPTYNNQETINECLRTIIEQDYPKDKFEIILIDGGSRDKTIEIVENYINKNSNIKLLENPYRIEEKGRVIGIENSKGEIIAFIDADNFLTDKEFFKKMITPLIENKTVAISQPKYYYFSRNDDIFTQQLGLLAGDDIIAISLGMYERFNYLTMRWTDSDIKHIKKERLYEVIEFSDLSQMPPIGSNGCFIKKDVLKEVKYDPFIHTDVCYRILKKGHLFSIVETGLVHKQNGNLITYIKKKNRRLNRNYDELQREFYQKIEISKIIKLVLKCMTLLPLFVEAIIGFIRKPAKFWFFYPILTEILFVNALIQVFLKILKGKKIWGWL